MRVARVFTGDEIDVAKNLERAVRDVCKIADRSGDEIQSAGHEAILQEKIKAPAFAPRPFGRVDQQITGGSSDAG